MTVFALAWLVTLGRHHFWILPNLTEDVGFFESFWPLYKHEYKPKGSESNKTEEEDERGKKDNDADKDSEAESVATTESAARSTNGFEILDTNDCNDE